MKHDVVEQKGSVRMAKEEWREEMDGLQDLRSLDVILLCEGLSAYALTLQRSARVLSICVAKKSRSLWPGAAVPLQLGCEGPALVPRKV